MKNRFLFLAILFLAILISCGEGQKQPGHYDEQTATDQVDGDYNDEQQKAPDVPDNEVDIVRKLIKDGRLEYKVSNLATERKKWEQATHRWKGYISNEETGHYDTRTFLSIVVRVPEQYFDSLLQAGINGVSHFDQKQIQVRDVTDEYVDIEARLKTKKELEQRYLDLLKKASTVSEILEIEREIGSLRADIESIEGRLNVLKNQVTLATLSINFYEEAGSTSFFGEKLANGFVSGWAGLVSFSIGIVTIWPIILFIALLFIFLRRLRTKNLSRK